MVTLPSSSCLTLCCGPTFVSGTTSLLLLVGLEALQVQDTCATLPLEDEVKVMTSCTHVVECIILLLHKKRLTGVLILRFMRLENVIPQVCMKRALALQDRAGLLDPLPFHLSSRL